MSLVLGIDLGVNAHLAVVAGPVTEPELVAVSRVEWRTRADEAAVVLELGRLLDRHQPDAISVEETFSAGARLAGRRDVGRAQEHQAAWLEGRYGESVRVIRVLPVDDAAARLAWIVLGRPSPWGAHWRDAYGVALRGMGELEAERRETRREAR